MDTPEKNCDLLTVWLVYNDGRKGTAVVKEAPTIWLGRWKHGLKGYDARFIDATTHPQLEALIAIGDLVGPDPDEEGDCTNDFEIDPSWWFGPECNNPYLWGVEEVEDE